MPRYPYGTRFTPPAPILPLRVGRPGVTPEVLLSALVDTGADLSVVPRGLAARLNLPPVDRLSVAGVDGIPRPLPVYATEVAIDGYRATIRIISLGAVPLVGRDLLNKITVHLNGPEATLTVDFP